MEAELQCSNGIQSMERKLRIACHASDANIDNVLKVNNSGLPPMFDGAALEGLNLSISGAHSKVALLEASKSVEKSKLLKLDEGFLLTIMLENFDTAAAISLLEITELDVYKTSAADMQGSTTRADGES
ncbi:unnamed protein product [Prunus armeniaca]